MKDGLCPISGRNIEIRDYFAIEIVKVSMQNYSHLPESADILAKHAFKIADALAKESERYAKGNHDQ